jgi:purine-nucleoside phosphorylase
VNNNRPVLSPENLFDLIGESSDYLRNRGIEHVDGALILGSGLGGVSDLVDAQIEIDYTDIPHMVGAAVESHKGRLVYGEREGKRLLVFSGRVHYYEGYPAWQVVFPVRIAAMLEADYVISTAAAGGLNPNFHAGDIVLVTDHVNLLPDNPLRGPNDARVGPRFPDMSEAYHPQLREAISKAASELYISLRRGVYAGLAGPSLETIAEYVHLHRIGADLVGMSMAGEAIAAAHSGVPFAGISVVSNMCYPPEVVQKTTVESVIETVSGSVPKVRTLIEKTVRQF